MTLAELLDTLPQFDFATNEELIQARIEHLAKQEYLLEQDGYLWYIP